MTFVNPVAEKEEEALMTETQEVEIAITVEVRYVFIILNPNLEIRRNA